MLQRKLLLIVTTLLSNFTTPYLLIIEGLNHWSSWGSWSKCSNEECGWKKRHRHCIDPPNKHCTPSLCKYARFPRQQTEKRRCGDDEWCKGTQNPRRLIKVFAGVFLSFYLSLNLKLMFSEY